jgi:Zn-dependent M28 family amino/carboxypeptidase
VACLLEIAQELAAGGPRDREVLFLLATAEEIGIVGTRFYLDHPSTPLERTVCNLEFEMIGRPDSAAGGAGRLWLTGPERTNLMRAYTKAGLRAVELVADGSVDPAWLEGGRPEGRR